MSYAHPQRRSWNQNGLSSGPSAVTSWGGGTSPTAGNLLLCWVVIQGGGTRTANTPAGWTLLGSGSATHISAYAAMYLFGRIATGGDTAPTVTFSASTGYTWQLEEWAVATTLPASPVAFAVDATAGTRTLTASRTSVVDGEWLVGAVGGRGGSTGIPTHSFVGLNEKFPTPDPDPTGRNAYLHTATSMLATAGDVRNASATVANSQGDDVNVFGMVAFPLPATTGIQLVGSATPARGGSGTATLTYIPTSSPDRLCELTVQHQGGALTSVTDDAGNTWTPCGDTIDQGASSQRIVGKYRCLAPTPFTTVTVVGSSVIQVLLDEYTGVGAFASAAVASNAVATNPPAAQVAGAAAGDLVTGAVAYVEVTAGARLDTLQAGYTEVRSYDNNGASTSRLSTAYATTVSGATGPTWVMSTGASTGEVTCRYTPAIGAGGKGKVVKGGARVALATDAVVKAGARTTATPKIIVAGARKSLA